MQASSPFPLLSGVLLVAGLVFVARRAAANPRPLPFSYPYETLPKDDIEVEQYVDTTFIRKYVDRSQSERVFDATYTLQTELEYGITDRLEFGLYLVFQQNAPETGDPSLAFDGTKQRIRYRIADEGDLPIDTAVYFEVVERHDEFELEQKLILQKRFGALKWMANLWVEQEWARGKSMELILNPTTGLTYQLDPRVWIGVEYWMRGTLENEAVANGAAPDSVSAFNGAMHHFAGPTLLLQFGRLWWSTGAYLRVDHLGRTGEVGDRFGKLWIRSVVGLEL